MAPKSERDNRSYALSEFGKSSGVVTSDLLDCRPRTAITHLINRLSVYRPPDAYEEGKHRDEIPPSEAHVAAADALKAYARARRWWI